MKEKIELFLVSGFLGSGKTTFLQNMLTQMSGHRIGVIVNEFGSIGIDGTVLQNGDLKMVEINNGSIFCACLKGGFVKTLVAFLEQPIDYLFVEASGLADPANMESFLDQMDPYLARKPHITREYNYRGSICVADAMHFLQFAEVFTPVKNQVIKSRFIVLNKIDDIDREKQRELYVTLHSLNPEAFLYPTNYGEVPLDVIEEHLRTEDIGEESFNTPWNRPAVHTIDMPVIESAEQIERFCEKIAADTVRIKGFGQLEDEEKYVHIDCVGENVVVREQMIVEKDIKNWKLIVISKYSIEDIIEQYWKEILNRPLIMEVI